MILAIISALIWSIITIKDIREYIDLRKKWGKDGLHPTFIVIDIAFVLFAVWAAYMLR